jgi:1,4-alpha-glucan branching enzyme
MMSQLNISPDTAMGATALAAGVTFRIWAPRATAVYLNGEFNGVAQWTQDADHLMARDGDGYWTGYVAGAKDGDPYKFFVVGAGNSGYKRDPYARELSIDPPFPHSNCLVRDSGSYPWHDRAFVTPDFSDMVVYQLHIGTYASRIPNAASAFLDVIEKIDYLVALGVNVLQPLPIDETETTPSLGYDGSDYFSPDFPSVVYDPRRIAEYLPTINRLLAAKGMPAFADTRPIATGPNQVKAMIDLCHLYGIAVVFDVVYNHAGGFFGDDEALYFWDRYVDHGNNDSLYFTDQGWAGGLSFALWNRDVRQFLINSATYYLTEFHVDGFRYDEISVLVRLNTADGWSFCNDLTGTVRFIKPRALQNAEYWPVDAAVVNAAPAGGAGFDVLQHDGLRGAIRDAIAQTSFGADAPVDLEAIAANMSPSSMPHAWQAVTCVENHDLVKVGKELRIAQLADGSDARSWYARSRSRVATALLLTAPGIPMLFMGQEFLEYKQWSDHPDSPFVIDWRSLDSGDASMVNHLRFTQDAIRLRRQQPALRGECARVFHVSNPNRVLALHRWLEGTGNDVVVAASLSDRTQYGYAIGFPRMGAWREIFNSDVYDHWVNPMVAGNGQGIDAQGPGMHGFPTSGTIVLPANAVVAFAREAAR